jgi:DNA adenine methylase
MNAEQPVLPFLKWPGGKRWAGCRITALIREHLTGTYYEPFLGGGAVFFELRPRRAVLSDINPELVNTYCVVRDSVQEIISRLKELPVNKRVYNRLRKLEPDEPISRAVRFLYLNRTAFGGIYRLNLKGKFNVPYGGGDRTPAVLWERALLRNASEALASAEVREADFEVVINLANKGDVVYCDPTYTVAHDCNGFIRYNERNFSWADQVRLADVARRARQRGAVVIISNANHRTIRRLYPHGSFRVLQRHSLVSTDVTKRRPVQELLVRLS